jgi:hypothetical protein
MADAIPASEFTRNFGRYRMLAQREAVAVSSRGSIIGYFVALTSTKNSAVSSSAAAASRPPSRPTRGYRPSALHVWMNGMRISMPCLSRNNGGAK